MFGRTLYQIPHSSFCSDCGFLIHIHYWLTVTVTVLVLVVIPLNDRFHYIKGRHDFIDPIHRYSQGIIFDVNQPEGFQKKPDCHSRQKKPCRDEDFCFNDKYGITTKKATVALRADDDDDG